MLKDLMIYCRRHTYLKGWFLGGVAGKICLSQGNKNVITY